MRRSNVAQNPVDHRQQLAALLDHHKPWNEQERSALDRTIEFVRKHEACFHRTLTIGHITGSAWLVDAAGRHALLTLHAKLGKWLQLGGHADGDPDVLAVALREAREESGIADLHPVSTNVFDVDVHLIPARGAEPAHYHYDVRFLVQTAMNHDRCEPTASEESTLLQWFRADEVWRLPVDESVLRLCEKWERRRAFTGA